MADQIYNNNEQGNENTKKPEAAIQKDADKSGISLFFGEKEKALFLGLGSEAVMEQLQETFLLYRIDIKTTKVHPVYGEAKKKNYLPEVSIYGRINVESDGPEYVGGLTRQGLGKISADVYLHHLEEKNVEIRIGDYIYHKTNYYEIIDDGKSNLSNEFAFGSDKLFFITIKGIEVNSDVFKAR